MERGKPVRRLEWLYIAQYPCIRYSSTVSIKEMGTACNIEAPKITGSPQWSADLTRKNAHIAGRPHKTLQSVVRYQRSRNQSAHQRGFKRMVNIPGRSKGCLTCRRRKVKCGKCKSWHSAGSHSLFFDQTKASLPANAATKGATTVKATRTHFVSSSIGPVLKSLSVKREKHRLRRQPKVQMRATGWLSAAVSAGVLVVRLVMKKLVMSKESWPLDHSSESPGSPH